MKQELINQEGYSQLSFKAQVEGMERLPASSQLPKSTFFFACMLTCKSVCACHTRT